MNRARFVIISLAAWAGFPAAARAASNPLHEAVGAPPDLRLSGSVRLRYETLTGQFRPGFDRSDDLISLRSTLFAEYRTGRFRIGGELYDSRAYAAEPGSAVSANDVNVMELVQAYVAADLGAPFGGKSGATVQAGRFTLNLGSRRLVASDDYRNTTNAFTGLRADLRSDGATNATLIYVLPQLRLPEDLPSVLDNDFEFDRESFDLRLWGGVLGNTAIPNLLVEATYLKLEERDAPGRQTRNRHLHTIGARVLREPKAGRLDFEAEAIGQFGSIRASAAPAAPRLDVSARFFHADLGYSFAGAWKPRLSVEYDHASGDGPGARYGRFDTLYGMRRADLAPAGIYAAIGRTNVSTPGIRLEAAPDKQTDLFAVYRALWAAEAADVFSTTGVRDPSGGSGRFAGHQIEGRVRHWIVPNVLRGEANLAWLVKRGLLRDAPNAPQTGSAFYASFAMSALF